MFHRNSGKYFKILVLTGLIFSIKNLFNVWLSCDKYCVWLQIFNGR